MDPIERISSIQESLKKLISELEALKKDLIGEAPVSFSAKNMGVVDQLEDIAKNFRIGEKQPER
jgi:hypothetical protein